MTFLTRLGGLLLSAVVVAGCSPQTVVWENLRSETPAIVSEEARIAHPPVSVVGGGYHLDATSLRIAGSANAEATRYYREAERHFYRPQTDDSHPAGLPRRCLAMSGGGLRSAMTNIGILRGLSRTGALARLDIISGVSGGSWALGWFYSEHFKRDASPEFSPVESDAPTAAEMAVYRKAYLLDAGLVLGIVAASPFLAAEAGLYGGTAHTLGGTWGIQIGDALGIPKYLSLGRVGDVALVKRLPLPIFQIRGRMASVEEALAFEATPIRWGSERLGYNSKVRALDLRWAMATSGAVSSHLSSRMAWPRATKSPFGSIVLDDGGFVDNLAVYPLIRRLCKQIVVVDATLDPADEFDDLTRLQELVKQRLGFDLEVNVKKGSPMDEIDQPITLGRVRGIPFLDGLEGRQLELQITYVKLSLDRRKLSQYPKSVRSHFEATKDVDEPCEPGDVKDRRDHPERCRFPQDKTLDVRYTEPKARAYSDLGAWLATQLVVEEQAKR